MTQKNTEPQSDTGSGPGGLAGWLLAKIRGRHRAGPRLKLVERIAVAPRQTIALVEAEGRRFLVAASQDAAPSFYPLDASAPAADRAVIRIRRRSPAQGSSGVSAARVSW